MESADKVDTRERAVERLSTAPHAPRSPPPPCNTHPVGKQLILRMQAPASTRHASLITHHASRLGSGTTVVALALARHQPSASHVQVCMSWNPAKRDKTDETLSAASRAGALATTRLAPLTTPPSAPDEALAPPAPGPSSAAPPTPLSCEDLVCAKTSTPPTSAGMREAQELSGLMLRAREAAEASRASSASCPKPSSPSSAGRPSGARLALACAAGPPWPPSCAHIASVPGFLDAAALGDAVALPLPLMEAPASDCRSLDPSPFSCPLPAWPSWPSSLRRCRISSISRGYE